jgi:hypothetical protein
VATAVARRAVVFRQERCVNDSGIPPVDSGFGRPSVRATPGYGLQREAGVSRPFLLMLLIIACVVLGALLSWGIKERAARARLSERNVEVEKSYVVVLAKRNDLASFLTDPRTRLYRLSGKAEAAGKSLTIAWQADTHSGVLIGDGVPLPGDDRAYAVWLLGQGGTATFCGTFRPDSAGTYYDFRVPTAGGEAAGGFRVTNEQGTHPDVPGQTVYETRS